MNPLLKGMPARLSILDYGLFQVHQDGRIIGISGYLIQTVAGENVLIDTGFPVRYAQDAKEAAQQDGVSAFGEVLALTPENMAPAQLACLGLKPSDIDLMIQSHTHIDHIGFMDAFPGVPILIGAAERALPGPLCWGEQSTMDWPDGPYLTLDADTKIGPEFEVLHVPGHSPGQLAFALHLPKTGPVLLTSDAISSPTDFDRDFAGAWDVVLARDHAQALMQRAARDRAMVVFGHSPDQWSDLRKAPEWYD